MRRFYILAAAAALSLTTLATPSPAAPYNPALGDPVALVDSWYRAYLGRSGVEDGGSGFWVDRLQRGDTPEAVQAGLLASGEYYGRAGNNVENWVRSVFRDAVGREASPRDVNFWGRRAYTQGLEAIAAEILVNRPGGGFNNVPQQPQYQPGPGGFGQNPQNYDYRRPYYPYGR